MAWYLNALGIVCALGSGKRKVAGQLFSGEATGVVTIEDGVSDGTALPFAPVTAELGAVPDGLQRFASRNLAMVLLALEEIDSDVHSAIERYGADRVAVVMGTSTSGISEGESALTDRMLLEGGEFPEGYDFLQQEIGSVAESVAVSFGLTAPALTLSTACSSSAKVLAVGRRLLRLNLADAVIVGGCDTKCALTLNGFHSLSALSTTGCRPFSATRDGTMIGEGAAVFLMSAEVKGPEFCGIGESSDAHNMTAPEPDGQGAATAMTAALADAGINAEQLNYINLHGTATRLNDAMESRALGVVCPSVLCSSSKGQVGHTLGAAGAIETALCWLTLECNPQLRLPPHCWDGEADPDALLPTMVTANDRLPATGRHYLMSNSYAFGGSNVSVILGSNHER